MVRTEFPFAVETVDPLWITLADGTRIAATLWRPRTDARVPVIVEMVPYRRRDGTVARDIDIHPWLAGHGMACARIDIRGSGDSDGDLADEYLPREQEDACEIIAHLAAQPWCNGNVGMTGISWGGFNALQVAARRPPALGNHRQLRHRRPLRRRHPLYGWRAAYRAGDVVELHAGEEGNGA